MAHWARVLNRFAGLVVLPACLCLSPAVTLSADYPAYWGQYRPEGDFYQPPASQPPVPQGDAWGNRWRPQDAGQPQLPEADYQPPAAPGPYGHPWRFRELETDKPETLQDKRFPQYRPDPAHARQGHAPGTYPQGRPGSAGAPLIFRPLERHGGGAQQMPGEGVQPSVPVPPVYPQPYYWPGY